MPRDAMKRHRLRTQLAIELEPQLLEHLRARAAADGRRWLEAGLSGALQRRAAYPDRVIPAARTGERVEPLRVPLGRGKLEIIGAAHLHPLSVSPHPPNG